MTASMANSRAINRDLTIRRVTRMLNAGHSVTEIASACGYSSTGHLYKRMRRLGRPDLYRQLMDRRTQYKTRDKLSVLAPREWESRRACDPDFTSLPITEQRQVCAGCPVRGECQALARDVTSVYGADPTDLDLWGGENRYRLRKVAA